jgi:hypothetical protein
MRKSACAAISRPTSSDIPAYYSASRRGHIDHVVVLGVIGGRSRTRQSGQADASACRCRPEGRRHRRGREYVTTNLSGPDDVVNFERLVELIEPLGPVGGAAPAALVER